MSSHASPAGSVATPAFWMFTLLTFSVCIRICRLASLRTESPFPGISPQGCLSHHWQQSALKTPFWWVTGCSILHFHPYSPCFICHLAPFKPEISYRPFTPYGHTHKAEGRCVCPSTTPTSGRHAVHLPWQADNGTPKWKIISALTGVTV